MAHRLIRFVTSWIAPFIYAILLLSPFSFRIFDIGGNYSLEGALVVVALLGFLTRDAIFNAAAKGLRQVKNPAVASTIAIITALFLIGALVKGNAAYAYGDYRSNLFVVFGFGIASQFKARDPLPLIRLGIATGLISLAAWYMQINGDAASTKFSSPYLCLTAAVLLACETRRALLAVFSAIILVVLAGVSFFRQYWIVAILTTLLLLTFSLRSFKGKARLRMLAALAIGTLVAVAVIVHEYSKIQAFFLDDQSRYIQSVGKASALMDTLNGGGKTVQEGDNLRLAYFQFLGTQPWKVVLPHGLDYRSTYDHIDPFFTRHGYQATTIDSLFFYLAYHYGLIITVPLLSWLYWSLWANRRRFGALPALSLMLVLTVGLLFDGGQAVIPIKSFWLGAFVALFARPVSIRWR
ncbi:hypothetical protein [Paraburkholderia sediminicola]|uniref:hypothetical protein n=1 Tax=Paraburkholderia sediminicola TaxID=458836 RepID=UPI0038BCB9BF